MSPAVLSVVTSIAAWQRRIGAWLAPVVLLALRLLVGICFFNTGLGKLTHLDKTTEFFESLQIPLPHLNAMMAGTTEMVGGMLLAAGLLSRLASVPLAVTMVVALLTAHLDTTKELFSSPDKFIELAPIPFLMTVLVVIAFGPGRLSVDGWIACRWSRCHVADAGKAPTPAAA